MRLAQEDEESKKNQVAAMEQRAGVEAEPRQRAQQDFAHLQHDALARAHPHSGRNVGPDERAVSVAAGTIIGLLGLSRRSLPGLVGAGVGAMLVYRGVTGRCQVSDKLGLRPFGEASAANQRAAVEIAAACTINKPREELYRFWRAFDNLPRFMEHLEAVRVQDDRRSHWIAKVPQALGGKVEWDAEITRDDANELIEWRSLPGSTIDTAGQVRFQPAPGDRGTEVHVWMNYTPPAGRLGHWLAAMFGHNPKRVVREELRNFQRLMEVGEILTLTGQPHGTCTGQGKRTRDTGWKAMFM